jgi:CubicO group peptidase (beta-lactamase class C family)
MNYKKTSLITALVFLFLSFQLVSQSYSLPRSEPEIQGVSSKKIIEFLDAVANSKNEMHSIMIVRHGKVIAEGWWHPYRPDLKHTLYSLSKSFTSTAIGFAVAEKKLTVNDKVISFFPDKLPDTISPNLASLTIKDLITMSAGQFPEPQAVIAFNDDWVKGFLAAPIVNKPGSVFLYNSLATYMLSAILQKVTGQNLVEYLTPRLFTPLGIQGMDWETDPRGISVGGWGLRLITEDIAKMGLLFLQKGKWNGKQILPASWIQEATTFKIDNAPGMEQIRKDSSDWRQGYAYQFWRSRHNSYRGDGAFGQYMIVMPEHDAVIAITSETPNMQEELDLVWQYLLPAMNPERSALSMNDAVNLKKRLAALKLALPVTPNDSSGTISGTITYKMQSNPKNIESIAVSGGDNALALDFKIKGTRYLVSFGNGKWIEGKTGMVGPSLVELAKNHFVGLPPSQVAGAYRWKGKNVLEAHLRYIDSPHTLYMTFRFDGDKISVDLLDSFSAPDKKITIKGEKIN